MARMYWDREKRDWVEYRPARPENKSARIQSDLKAFKSPLEGHKVIEGRYQLREELARNNCRQVDPSEWKAVYKNPSFALKRGLPLDGAN